MKGEMEYKAFQVEFKATGDKGEYEGHFSVFGNIDDGLDVMHEGAFAKTIAERGKRVKVFYAHDWMKLIGPAPDVLKEDAIGLFAQGRLTLESFWGKEVWALMKDNALNEGSIGYLPVKYDYEVPEGKTEWERVRHLREVMLYEISPVPLGMNALSSVQALKAALAPSLSQGERGIRGSEDPVAWWAEKAAAVARELSALKDVAVTPENKTKVASAAAEMRRALDDVQNLTAAEEPQPKMVHSSLLVKRLRAAELALAQLK